MNTIISPWEDAARPQIMRKNKINFLLRLLGLALLIDLGLLVVVILIGRFAGWSTPGEYASALQMAGILAIGLGLLGIKGTWDSTRSFQYQYSLSVTSSDSWERTKQTAFDFLQTYMFLVVMFLVGLVSLILGVLIPYVFPPSL